MTTEEVRTETSPEEKFFGVTSEADVATKEELDNLEIEVVEQKPVVDEKPDDKAEAKATQTDDDDELTDYSDKVQKRIKHMTWEKHEEGRRADKAEAERQEAINFAQNVLKRNQEYENIINSGEARLVAEFKGRAEMAAKNAENAYAVAHEDGDTAKIVEAQKDLINAQAQVRTAAEYEGDYGQRNQQFQAYRQQPPPVYRPQTPAVPKPTNEAASWAKDNPWFGDDKHKDMTALAYGVHEDLVRNKGIRPDTDEYFKAINSTMKQRFPEYFETDTTEKTVSKPQTVVADARRSNGTKPRKVTLTPTQVAIAKELNLTVEQYAHQVAEDMNNV